MRDWVKSFLIQDSFDQMEREGFPEEVKKEVLHLREKELETPDDIWCELTTYFSCDFSMGGIGGVADDFRRVFGSVLANLPKEAFDKIRKVDNLFFFFIPQPGAVIKGIYIEKKGKVWIVIFPYELVNRPYKVLRGEIAHELAHIYAGHPPQQIARIVDKQRRKGDWNREEDEADEIARSWGFKGEIKALKDYRESQTGRK